MPTAVAADETGRAETPVRERVERWRCRAGQYGLTLSLAVPGRLWSLVLSPTQRRLGAATVTRLRQRFDALLERGGEIADALYRFPAAYHEPYYKGYLRDDLAAVARACGFLVEDSAPHLVAKVVVARKPEPPRRRRGAGRRRMPA